MTVKLDAVNYNLVFIYEIPHFIDANRSLNELTYGLSYSN